MLSESGWQDFKMLDAGQYVARCYTVVDLGTRDAEWQGVKKKRREVRFTFEFPTETAVFKDGEKARPYSISKSFTYSLAEKSNLRPFLETWRGKKFTSEELQGFDISKLVGVPLFANVTHEVNTQGKKFAVITSVMPVPKWMTCEDQVNESLVYSPYTHDDKAFTKLHIKTQERIMESDEMVAKTSFPESKTATTIEDVPF